MIRGAIGWLVNDFKKSLENGPGSYISRISSTNRNKKVIAVTLIAMLAGLGGLVGWHAQSAPKALQVSDNQAGDASGIKANLQEGALETNISADSSVSVSNESNSNIDVRVNGKSVPLPDDGSVHKVIKDDESTTTVDINVDSNSSSSGDERHRSSSSYEYRSKSSIEVESN